MVPSKKKIKFSLQPLINSMHLISATKSQDMVAFVIQANLHFENVLYKKLAKKLNTESEKLTKKTQLRFKILLELCYLSTLIDKETYQALLKFNSLRNDLAHKLGYKITKEEMDKLLAIFPETVKKSAKNLRSETLDDLWTGENEKIKNLKAYTFSLHLKLESDLETLSTGPISILNS